MIKKLTYIAGAMALVLTVGCGGGSEVTISTSGGGEAEAKPKTKHKIAYVTNGIDPFWDLCAAGVRQAESELGGVECEVHFPPKGLADQKSILETLLAKGIKGIAVSPIDADGQTKFLNEVAAQTKLITHDADAPKSDRLVYIGTDNYKAGRALGQLVKEAIPDGGEVAIFVGRLEQLNARQRRQGVIDELLDRPSQALGQIKFDEVAKVFKGEKYTIVDTRTDNFVMDAAKSNAEDAITKYENLACMVGLFAYNPPRCLQAIKEAGKLGQIKVCGFDEDDALLQAIKDGHAMVRSVSNRGNTAMSQCVC